MDKRFPGSHCPIPARIHRKGAPQAAAPGQARAIQKKIATLDFETWRFTKERAIKHIEPKAFAAVWTQIDLAGVITQEVFWSEKEEEVIAWAVKRVKKFDGICYAHNGGKFDFLGYLFKQGGKLLWGEPVKMVGSRIVQMKFGLCELRDSYAILPAPLRDYDKGKISYAKFEPGIWRKYIKEIVVYMKRDGRSLLDLVLRFLGEHGLRPLTAASAAMAAIKASGVKIENFDERLDEKFRKWYFGGRVQVFSPGVTRGHFYVYDIKSAYPHAMLEKHATSKKFKHVSKPKRIENTDFVCLRGSVKGCFPIRTKSGLRFPFKPETYFVTGWEYNAAKMCSLLARHLVLYVERADRLSEFGNYVTKFYEQKKAAELAGDRAGKLIAKILINSGYGKLAQRPDKWRDYVIVDPKAVIPLINTEGWREEMVEERFDYAVWSRPCQSPPHYYHVACAASITGAVRARLMRQHHLTPACYMDTDSLILKDRKMPTGKNLGDWDLEVEGDLLMIAGKKLYGLRVLPKYAPTKAKAEEKGYHWYKGRAWKMATKGCRLTPLELARVCSGKIVKYHNQAPTYSFTSPTRWINRDIRITV